MGFNSASGLKECGHPVYHASNTLLYLYIYLLLNCDRTKIPALCKYLLVFVPRMGGNAMLAFQGKKTNLKKKLSMQTFSV